MSKKSTPKPKLQRELEGTCIKAIDTRGEIIEITHRNGGSLIFWDDRTVYVYHNDKFVRGFTIPENEPLEERKEMGSSTKH